jgi:UDP-N-acetylmuramate--alanine ligase
VRIDVPAEILGPHELGPVHFIGIGGAGLSAIARILLARGVPVSGSDGSDSPTLASLATAGARVFVGHRAEHLGDAQTVVVSTAIPADNPEVLAALSAGLRVWPRSAALASVMQGKQVLAVAGTHGKTTTTSLLTTALQAAGADPAYTIGGDLSRTGSNAADGTGGYFVAEADESDGAFLVYRPYAAIVTNVEADHLDHYGSEDAYRDAFDEFADTVDADGFLVCVVDDPGADRLATRARARGRAVVTVAETARADLRATDLTFAGSTSTFSVEDPAGSRLGTITLRIPGRHYVLDALAALAVGLRLGFGFDRLAQGLAEFTGTHRRMEFKGEEAGVRVYDSYAHHPREISADLQAARAVAGTGRLVVAFQPHLVSRTRIFAAEMGAALTLADEVVVLDIYLAREAADPTVSGRDVADSVGHDRVLFEPDFDAVPQRLVERAAPGDLILTLGAGSVTALGPRVLGLLQERADG